MDVFSWFRRGDGNGVVHKYTFHRRFCFSRHDDHFVTFANATGLDLTHRHAAPVVIPVEQRYPERSIGVPALNLELIEHLQQRLLRGYGMALLRTGVPPLACFAVDLLQNIGTRQAGDGYEPDLLLDDITARF